MTIMEFVRKQTYPFTIFGFNIKTISYQSEILTYGRDILEWADKGFEHRRRSVLLLFRFLFFFNCHNASHDMFQFFIITFRFACVIGFEFENVLRFYSVQPTGEKSLSYRHAVIYRFSYRFVFYVLFSSLL